MHSSRSCVGLQRNDHFHRKTGTRRDRKHTRLRFEIAGVSCRIRDAMPGLDADEIGPWLRPEAKIGRDFIVHPDAGSHVGAVGDATAADFIEDDGVLLKQTINEREATLRDGRWMTLRREQSIGIETPDRGGFLAREFDEMI